MGISGKAAHGALHSALLVAFMTFALLAGSSCGHRVLSQLPPLPPLVKPQTLNVANNLPVTSTVTMSFIVSGLPPFGISVFLFPGQTAPIVLPISTLLGSLIGTYSVTFTAGGQVYVLPQNLLQQILDGSTGVSITLSVCVGLPPDLGLSVAVTVGDESPTLTCLAPPNSSPPPPSPPPPSPSPPAPTPSPPPPSPSPPAPTPSPPPPSSSPPAPTPSPPPPSPSPPAPTPSPPPPPHSPPPPTPSTPAPSPSSPPPPSPPPPSPSPPPPTPSTPAPSPSSPPPPSPPATSPSPPPPPSSPPAPPPSYSPPPPPPASVVIGLNITNLLQEGITFTLTVTVNGNRTVLSVKIISEGSHLLTLPVGYEIISIIITKGASDFTLTIAELQTIDGVLSPTGQLQVSTCPSAVADISVKAATSVARLSAAPGVCVAAG